MGRTLSLDDEVVKSKKIESGCVRAMAISVTGIVRISFAHNVRVT